MRTAAIDIGGTMIKSGVWDGTRLEQIKEYPTDLSLGGASLMRHCLLYTSDAADE